MSQKSKKEARKDVMTLSKKERQKSSPVKFP
jgi:hypothetical protein